jgi:hypothetical protein
MRCAAKITIQFLNTMGSHWLLALSAVLLLQADVSSSFSPISRSSSTNHNRFSSWRSSTSSSHRHRHRHRNINNINMSSASSDESSPPIDMSDLNKRMKRQENQYVKLLQEQSNYALEERTVPEAVHIILFHPGTEEQHVHTIEFPQSSGNNIIMAFESEGECVEFANKLQDLEFVDPSPEQTMFEPFAEYCEMSGMSLMIVPKGFELSPPQLNSNDDVHDDEEDLDDDDIAMLNDLASQDNGDNGDDLDAWG